MDITKTKSYFNMKSKIYKERAIEIFFANLQNQIYILKYNSLLDNLKIILDKYKLM